MAPIVYGGDDVVLKRSDPLLTTIFNWSRLDPGEGHPFALADEKEFAQMRTSILTTRTHQALRVAGLDVDKAQRWGADGAPMRRELDKARSMIGDDPASALRTARSASRSAQAALDEAPVYASAATALAEAQKLLGDMEILLNLSVEDRLQGDEQVKPTAMRVLDMSEQFSALKRKLYFGDAEGLADSARALLPQVKQTFAEVRRVTGRGVPKTLHHPRPWRHQVNSGREGSTTFFWDAPNSGYTSAFLDLCPGFGRHSSRVLAVLDSTNTSPGESKTYVGSSRYT